MAIGQQTFDFLAQAYAEARPVPLFPFQQEDVDYLADEPGALISNEMGTGKTYEAVARDRGIRQQAWGPTLVVAPLVTLESVWQAHFEELTDLRVFTTTQTRLIAWRQFCSVGGDVFCAHWEAVRLMPELAEVKWLHVIADECHRMKNRRAKQTQAIKAIPALWRTAMSGTPVVNRPDELWSVLNWLHPKEYTSYWRFFNRYVYTENEYVGGQKIRKIIGPRHVERLQAEMKPFLVRRLKTDVLKDLPEKYRTEIKVTLTPTQRSAYNGMRDEMIAWIGEQTETDLLPAPVVIAQLTRLQQFACAYAEFGPDGKIKLAEPSSKLDALMEVLEEAAGEPVVVFSRFRSLIDLLAVRLEGSNISYATFTGATDAATRTRIVDQFQAGQLQVFAGTISAGGVGLTLHQASTVVFLDRDWSPAANEQAEDRLHRVGQRNAVQVIDIIARNTVEPRKLQAIDLKKEWIKRILDGTADHTDE